MEKNKKKSDIRFHTFQEIINNRQGLTLIKTSLGSKSIYSIHKYLGGFELFTTSFVADHHQVKETEFLFCF